LSYPSAPAFVVGKAIAPLMPTVTGAVAGYSVSPALPAGLGLDATTGTISGTPTTVAMPASYTVTASNSAGQTTAKLTLSVESGVLLDLGHAAQVVLTRLTSSRLLSVDETGHWVLWDYAAATNLAGGNASCSAPASCSAASSGLSMLADLAGSTLVVQRAGGLEIRSAADGSLLGTVTATLTWWKLAADGSYVAGGSASGLTAWSPQGAVITSITGDYSKARAFAAPGEIRVALGPAGASVVQTVSLPAGTLSTGPAFQGQFNAWFQDGERFLTNIANAVRIYSKASVQQDIAALPAIDNLTGQGNWFWTYQSTTPGYPLRIYKVGAGGTASSSYALGADDAAIPSGPTIGVLQYGTGLTSVIDLSGSSPARTDHALPTHYGSAYAAVSSSQWVEGNRHGVLVDGASLGGTPRYFGLGTAWSIAGGDQRVAVATASGKVLFFDAATEAQQGSIDFSSSRLGLSADGTVLAAAADEQDAQYSTDWSIKLYSLPAATQTRNWSYTYGSYPLPFDLSLSSSGTVIGQVLGTFNGSTWTYTRQANATATGALLWSDSISGQFQPIRLSTDGSLIAVSSSKDSQAGTNVYLNGSLSTAVSGWAAGWLAGNRLLVNNYTVSQGNTTFKNCVVYSSTGTPLGTPPLPELSSIQAVGSDDVYDQVRNSIYSATSGAVLWSTSSPALGVGAVAGPRVVFASGAQVRAEPY